ncbi:hypothetical protein BTO14_04880 [Polaribacter butkevichii]|uniref:Alpha-L-arabinofuranosidase n=1 Tax=Polaribacter butkevichii TaxID=218490 RepID=A0A2P6CCN1_9FLAO|nr:hypothetical protein BTO14_04880 [Polaribacter butkevichii]
MLLCVISFSCTSEVDDDVTGANSATGDGWFTGLDLPFADKTGYPYKSDKMTTATLSINTSSKFTANNLLLGANFGGFSSNEEKEIIRFLKPVTVHFPNGVWANWYNWEKDISEYDATDSYDIGDFHRGVMDDWAANNTTTGFPGMKTLHDELAFNTLFTYNVNYDSPAKSLERLKDREAKGFDVQYVELGNEQYFEDQRAGRTSSTIFFGRFASQIATALKNEKPNLKIAVPYGWRDNEDAAYNLQVGFFGKSFYDAISLHRNIEVENTTEDVVKSPDAYKTILNSRLTLKESSDFALSFLGEDQKPIWLSEWGVSCGLNAASFLGQADVYMYLFENQDLYERAEWNGLLDENPMYTFEGDKSLANMKKTGYGAVYEITRDVFENSEVYESTISTRILDTDVNAVEAKAVTKNGETIVYAVNKTVRSVPFRVKVDGVVSDASKKHEALSFDSLQDNKLLNMDESPLTLINEGTEIIVLPPLSVNKISF